MRGMRFILGIINALCGRWVHTVVDGLKLQAAAAYVAGVRKTRKAFIALLGLASCLLLAMSGFLFIHVALFVWLPLSLWIKALGLLIIGVAYLVIGLAVVFYISSDRAWMKFAKVDRLMEDLRPRR